MSRKPRSREGSSHRSSHRTILVGLKIDISVAKGLLCCLVTAQADRRDSRCLAEQAEQVGLCSRQATMNTPHTTSLVDTHRATAPRWSGGTGLPQTESSSCPCWRSVGGNGVTAIVERPRAPFHSRGEPCRKSRHLQQACHHFASVSHPALAHEPPLGSMNGAVLRAACFSGLPRPTHTCLPQPPSA